MTPGAQDEAALRREMTEIMADAGARAAEAEQAEMQGRDLAWIDPEPTIAGISCRAFTLRDWQILDLAKNPLLTDSQEEQSFAGACQFLWWMNKEFTANELDKNKFIYSLSLRDHDEITAEVQGYLQSIFMDFPNAPRGSFDGHGSKPRWSFVTVIIHRLASEYGFSKDYYTMPYAQLRQLLNYLTHLDALKAGKEASFNACPSQRIRLDGMARYNELEGQLAALKSNG